MIYDDGCHLKKCYVNPVRIEVTAMFKRLGKMDMIVEHFMNDVDPWSCKPNCNPHNRKELHGVSVYLSVCPSVYRYQKFGFIKQVAKG